MFTFTTLLGLFLILIGFLVVRYPMLISGYNTLPKEKRDAIDIKSYSRMMRRVFCVMGIITIVTTPLLKMAGQEDLITVVMLVTGFGGCFYLIYRQKRYLKASFTPDTATKFATWMAVVITVLVFGGCFWAGWPAGIKVKNDTLVISGAYGLELPKDQIEKVEIRQSVPPIELRSNGISIYKIHKGHYQSSEMGAIRLFFHSGKPPYLYIYPQKGKPIIINRSTEKEIQGLYDALQPKLQ